MLIEHPGLSDIVCSVVVFGVDISVVVLGEELSVAVSKAEPSIAVFGAVPSAVAFAAGLFIVEFGAELPVDVAVVMAELFGSVTMLMSGTGLSGFSELPTT